MDGSEITERERHLANVKSNGYIGGVPERYRSDPYREIFLAAVKKDGLALHLVLEFAAEECKADRESPGSSATER
eukprot:463157-Amphidinium_carterae.1